MREQARRLRLLLPIRQDRLALWTRYCHHWAHVCCWLLHCIPDAQLYQEVLHGLKCQTHEGKESKIHMASYAEKCRMFICLKWTFYLLFGVFNWFDDMYRKHFSYLEWHSFIPDTTNCIKILIFPLSLLNLSSIACSVFF